MKQPIEVVMLPTEDITHIVLPPMQSTIFDTEVDNIPEDMSGWRYQHLYITVSQDIELIKEGDWSYYKDGFDSSLFKVTKIDKKGRVFEGITAYPSHKCKKIIATTDPKLTKSSNWVKADVQGHWNCTNCGEWTELIEDRTCKCNPVPKIHQSFLKEYIDNPDKEYVVEYEEHKLYAHGPQTFIKLKLNQDNTVNITSVETPSYEAIRALLNNRNITQGLSNVEFEKLLMNFAEKNVLIALQKFWQSAVVESTVEYKDIEDWIKQNL